MKKSILILMLTGTFLSLTAVMADDEAGRCPGSLTSVPSFERLSDATDHVNSIITEESDGEEPAEEARRFELFRFEKDYNQKNVLHYGIMVNMPSCTISYKANGAPNFSTYWIMGEERGQKKNMTKDDLKRVGPIVLAKDVHSVRFKMKALNDINIRKKEITIEAELVRGECKVKGYAELDDGRKVDLSRIFANISTFLGIPTGVSALTVDGNDRATGERVSVRFRQ